MHLNLHQNARTTPTIRRELQASAAATATLARRYHLNPITVRQGRGRDFVEDASQRPHTRHANLSPGQELLMVELRKILLLDDLLAVTHEFVNETVSRSGLDRCLRHHGVSNLAHLIPREEAARTPAKTFKDYEPGYGSTYPRGLTRTPASTCSTPSTAPPAGSKSRSCPTSRPSTPAPSSNASSRLPPSRSPSCLPTTARRSQTASLPTDNASPPATMPATRSAPSTLSTIA